ncbi:unnamed protein product [Rodentolepis nana]|uniref:NFACT-R_1 domain-containing protein n=1 Tax=Rodentolepis nana TaxID=102285 RepID=A0A0R3TKH2_RODNA|nr:unnamed protein product [Rodentolepis nana]
MFSYDDQCFFLRILECKKCQLRRLYHKLAAKELASRNAAELISEPIKIKRHFHSITRLLRVINSIDQQIKNTKSRYEQLQIRKMVCNEHVIDVYEFVIRAADDNVHHLHLSGIGSSPPAKWVKEIIPPGQTELYFVGSGWKRRDFQTSILCDIVNKSMTLSPEKKQSKAIRDANRRWAKGYSNVESAKVEQKEEGKSVRFARGNGLVTEHRLIYHAGAAKILRKDKTWVLESLHRQLMGDETEEPKKLGESNNRRVAKTSVQPEEDKGEDGEGNVEEKENFESISFENEVASIISSANYYANDNSSEEKSSGSQKEDSEEDSDDDFADF